jgi:hypothetical protein
VSVAAALIVPEAPDGSPPEGLWKPTVEIPVNAMEGDRYS